MDKEKVRIICGPGRGKTSTALGQAVQELNRGKSVIMIQFMKGTLKLDDDDFLKRLEPELKIFRFEKLAVPFEQLSEKERLEEIGNIKNGLNFANKVLTTGECDVLILDEILGLLDLSIIGGDDIKNMICNGEEDMELILTGQKLPECLKDIAGEITMIQKV
ncbi:cob(I)yrinic acid a,c-diamide adenosyltransferase [Lachnospiraceae bacterium 62-35]